MISHREVIVTSEGLRAAHAFQWTIMHRCALCVGCSDIKRCIKLFVCIVRIFVHYPIAVFKFLWIKFEGKISLSEKLKQQPGQSTLQCVKPVLLLSDPDIIKDGLASIIASVITAIIIPLTIRVSERLNL